MNESDWRSKLIKAFNKAYSTRGYIWANDVRYKAGFPDLEVMLNGNVAHYELKLCKGTEFKNQMSLLQIAVCNRIAMAGVHVSCLTYMPDIDYVYIRGFNPGPMTYESSEYNMPLQVFNQKWINAIYTCDL